MFGGWHRESSKSISDALTRQGTKVSASPSSALARISTIGRAAAAVNGCCHFSTAPLAT